MWSARLGHWRCVFTFSPRWPIATNEANSTHHVERAIRSHRNPAGRRAAGFPPPREAERVHLQYRLHLLLLPVEGGALSERKAPDVGCHAGRLHSAIAGVASRSDGHGGVARRRADADEARLLQARGGAC